MNGHTLIDLRAFDAKERGNPEPQDAIPFVMTESDLKLAEKIRETTDQLGGKGE